MLNVYGIRPGDLEEIKRYFEALREKRLSEEFRPLLFEDSYECDQTELSVWGGSEDEWLAHIAECYCRNNHRVPSDEEYETWLDIRSILGNIIDCESETWPDDIRIRFQLDGLLPTVTLNSEKKSVCAAFITTEDNNTALKIPGVYLWKDFYNVLGTYFSQKTFDTESKYWIVIMDKTCIDSRPDNYFNKSPEYDWDNLETRTFAEALLRLIDKRKMTEAECYKKARVSRAVFSNLINPRKDNHPSRKTVYAFAIALGLTLEETKKFLATAGMSIDRNAKWERIVVEEIARGNHDIDLINIKLYEAGEERKLLEAQLRNNRTEE